MKVEQQVSFMADLVRNFSKGDLVPASFQRPYVWTKQDVESLWTSILNGWPIGSLLLWSPPRDLDLTNLSRTRLGPIEHSGSPWSAMILDGQNRLASLAWSMAKFGDPRPDVKDLFPQEALTWEPSSVLVIDHDIKAVHFVPIENMESGIRFPVSALLDGTMNAWLRKIDRDNPGLSDDTYQWFDDVGHNIRATRMAVTELKNATPAEAVQAFRHIAKVGQPVSVEDIENALSWLDDNQPKF